MENNAKTVALIKNETKDTNEGPTSNNSQPSQTRLVKQKSIIEKQV
jgi:hypothetical protein